MNDGEPTSLEQIQAFLEGTIEMRFEMGDQREVYGWADKAPEIRRTQAVRKRLGAAVPS